MRNNDDQISNLQEDDSDSGSDFLDDIDSEKEEEL
jgi:hypothetical protein